MGGRGSGRKRESDEIKALKGVAVAMKADVSPEEDAAKDAARLVWDGILAMPAGPDRAVAFINQLTHAKGRGFAGQPFNLRSWQERIVRQLFTVNSSGMRRYRTALLMLPRKNGKSELAAAIALYGLLGDDEPGAEVYSAAADRDQASLVFNVAVAMIENDPWLRTQCLVIASQKRIVHVASRSFYRAVSAEAYSKHGFNASMVIYDELHAAPNRELWDVLATSQGAREQPLMFAISTAGYDRNSILYELYSHACEVRDGAVEDHSFLPVIYEAPKDADWADEAVWAACNPALGDFRSLEDMRVLANRAKAKAAQQNSYRRLYLNQWTEQSERWLSMDSWDACKVVIVRQDLIGRRCYLGMDLSTTTDLTALCLLFPSEHGLDVLPMFFMPRDNLLERGRQDHVDYNEWVRLGYIIATPGNVIDYDAIRRLIQQWAQLYDIHEVAFDPHEATHIVQLLQDVDKLPCRKVPQGFASLTSATKTLEAAVSSRRLRHDGNPVLRWNVANAAVEYQKRETKSGYMMLSKAVSTQRIDGVAALVMAVDALEHDPEPESVYEGRGILVL
jgi:phage terminase large subunit-like protein